VVLAAPWILNLPVWLPGISGNYRVCMVSMAARRRDRARPSPGRGLARMLQTTTFVIAGLPLQAVAITVLALPWVSAVPGGTDHAGRPAVS
jgi:hypothetical protein